MIRKNKLFDSREIKDLEKKRMHSYNATSHSYQDFARLSGAHRLRSKLCQARKKTLARSTIKMRIVISN